MTGKAFFAPSSGWVTPVTGPSSTPSIPFTGRGGRTWSTTGATAPFPVVRYVRNGRQLLGLVERFHGTHMVCYGINPRPGIRRYPSGYPRAHRDSEIELVRNFFLDFDLRAGADAKKLASLELFLEEVTGRVEDMGFLPPVRAFTGNGFHLLFAIPAVRVGKCPDIRERIRAFREKVLLGLGERLAAVGARVDSTDDLSRVAKIYGTAKPGGRLSRFYGDGARREDKNLREHLLSLDVIRTARTGGLDSAGTGNIRQLPEGFARLLEEDERIRNLWLGKGKETGDLTRSGYDYSLLRECLARGITDVRELAAILALRPGGSVRDGPKGEQYIRVTIAKAVRDFQWGA
ncbi:MAG: hypothetical protein JRJ03_19570 [Deltaproteobacteria bacterium]|nr:hypothetical protein [Deltaproteobacteria bacterium]